MQWEQLTVPDFARAVTTCRGLGILPMGVLEPHATHLPLGMDMLASHQVACRAAEVEPAIVFPPYPFGINHEGAHLPGGLVIRRDLAMQLLENVCDEMARNGLKKILLLSGHGGNRFLAQLFVQTFVERRRDYVVYYRMIPGRTPPGLLQTQETGHACERETSAALALFPDLVKMQDVPQQPFTNRRRNQPLAGRGVYSPMDWFGMYPTMQVGDARPSTAEKGRAIVESAVEELVAILRDIKADAATAEMMRQFNDASDDPLSGR